MISLVIHAVLALSILEAAVVGDPQGLLRTQRPGLQAPALLVARRINQPRAQTPFSGVATTSSAGASGVALRPTECFNVPDPGECRGAFPRFFYNRTLDQCDCFLYGGCDNEILIQSSSWLSLAECNSFCRPGNTQEGPMCRLLPKDDNQSSTQINIVENPDTSHISDNDFLDQLENSSV